MSGASKSVNMIDLLTQTEPYYDYTVIVEEELSYGIYTQTVAEGAEPIIIQPNGSFTFNYLDTSGLPLTSLQIANATALCQLMAGNCQDEDKNRLRGAQLSGAIRQLYRDFYEDWKRKHPTQNHELVHDTVALTKWRKEKLPPGATMIEAFVDLRDADDSTGEHAEMIASITEEELANASQDQVIGEDVFRLAFAAMRPHEMPSHGQLQEVLSMDGHGSGGEDARHLAQLLEPWCSYGNYLRCDPRRGEQRRSHWPHRALRTRLHPRIGAGLASRRGFPHHQPCPQRSHDAAARCAQACDSRRVERLPCHPRWRPHHA
ncbi:MAG: hypothetical protein ACI91F_002541 [Candidatus Binatia bacterium]|jgi:hypothetical protein